MHGPPLAKKPHTFPFSLNRSALQFLQQFFSLEGTNDFADLTALSNKRYLKIHHCFSRLILLTMPEPAFLNEWCSSRGSVRTQYIPDYFICVASYKEHHLCIKQQKISYTLSLRYCTYTILFCGLMKTTCFLSACPSKINYVTEDENSFHWYMEEERKNTTARTEGLTLQSQVKGVIS